MSTSNEDRCILLFAKYPDKGTVKTRLAPDLHGVSAEELYRAFVLDSFSLLERSAIPFIICYYPEHAEERFGAWLGTNHTFIPQHGQDLGERMQNGFRHAFSIGFEHVIALGTDSPDLPSDFITDAFSSLGTHDAAIGPCDDGGYYLIGFNKDPFLPEAFDGIRWSTDQVFSQTMEQLKKGGRKTHILPPWRDVDTVEDLRILSQRGLNTDFKTSYTMALLLKSRRI